MRGTSPALIVLEAKEPPSGNETHVNPNNDAEESGVDTRDDRRQSLLAGAPIPRDGLSTVMAPHAERMCLLSHAKSFTILSRWMLLIEGFLRGA